MKIFILLVVLAFANGELAPLKRAPERISDRHIVVLESDMDVDSFASRFQIDAAMIGQRPNIVRKLRTALNALIADLNPEALQLVRSLPGVKYVEEDSMGFIENDDPWYSWGTDRVNQRDLPRDYNDATDYLGYGANIYILDTGININHNDFGVRASQGDNYVGGDFDGDCHGHGTHCAGTAAGSKTGVAKQANVIAVKVCNCAGGCSASALVSGVDFVGDQKKGGVENVVASMSLSVNSDSFKEAVEGAIAKGVVAITSSGNNGYDACNLVPGKIDEVITVGNTQIDDTIRSSSNYGSCVDILAPGTDIVSCSNSGTGYTTKTGTSMACPHVAGAAGIALANNNIQPDQVSSFLVGKASSNKISGLRTGTPNKLLYVE